MNTTNKKTKKTKGLNGVVKPKKQLTTAEKDKVIKELSQKSNRNITRRYLMDLALGRI
ncbi:hypothetical protein ACI760_11190 [Capnocytophaga canimorsus]|uniref:hypothetical protein n=1 Tax=Capnocytophaga canimorsus TaxID=28188 RepID=UPI00385A1176